MGRLFKLGLSLLAFTLPNIAFSTIVKISEWEGINPNTKQFQKVYTLGDVHQHDVWSGTPLEPPLSHLKREFISFFKEKDLSRHLLIVEDKGADFVYKLDNLTISKFSTSIEYLEKNYGLELIFGLSKFVALANPKIEVFSAEVRQFDMTFNQEHLEGTTFHLAAELESIFRIHQNLAKEIQEMDVPQSVKNWSSEQFNSSFHWNKMSELKQEVLANTSIADFAKKQQIQCSDDFNKLYLIKEGIGLVDVPVIHKLLTTRKEVVLIVLGLGHIREDIEPILTQLNYRLMREQSVVSEDILTHRRSTLSVIEFFMMIQKSIDLVKESLPRILQN